MTADKPGASSLSVSDMRSWLSEEIRNVLKESELRLRDATEFTTAYAMGRLSAEQANKRLSQYDERWGDALGGIYASSYKNDDAILNALDEARRSDRIMREKYERIAERGRKGSPGFERWLVTVLARFSFGAAVSWPGI